MGAILCALGEDVEISSILRSQKTFLILEWYPPLCPDVAPFLPIRYCHPGDNQEFPESFQELFDRTRLNFHRTIS